MATRNGLLSDTFPIAIWKQPKTRMLQDSYYCKKAIESDSSVVKQKHVWLICNNWKKFAFIISRYSRLAEKTHALTHNSKIHRTILFDKMSSAGYSLATAS